MWKCPQCHWDNEDAVGVCEVCGSEKGKTTVQCPSCKADNESGHAFCGACGKALHGNHCGTCGTEVTPGERYCAKCSTPEKKGNAKAPFVIIMAVVLLAMVSYIAFGLATRENTPASSQEERRFDMVTGMPVKRQ